MVSWYCQGQFLRVPKWSDGWLTSRICFVWYWAFYLTKWASAIYANAKSRPWTICSIKYWISLCYNSYILNLVLMTWLVLSLSTNKVNIKYLLTSQSLCKLRSCGIQYWSGVRLSPADDSFKIICKGEWSQSHACAEMPHSILEPLTNQSVWPICYRM